MLIQQHNTWKIQVNDQVVFCLKIMSESKSMQHQTVGHFVNNELVKTWKWSWPNLKYFPSILTEGMKATKRNLMTKELIYKTVL
jgi:hypothetical protein